MKGKRLLVCAAVLAGIVGILLISNTVMADYETAEYELIERDGKFEVRDYQPIVVVTTKMARGEDDGSFGRLFKYISGSNEKEQKIAMTTPVFMPADADGKTEEMQFVVPEEVAKKGPPMPESSSVKIKKRAGGKFAVLRFRGRASDTDRKEQLSVLNGILNEKGLSSSSAPIFAGYDPPWTPGPMRRNEVLLKLN
tara:strand:- start:37 stop:624 length:588 start_codon:yes stop_codon:yes gene_type:complete